MFIFVVLDFVKIFINELQSCDNTLNEHTNLYKNKNNNISNKKPYYNKSHFALEVIEWPDFDKGHRYFVSRNNNFCFWVIIQRCQYVLFLYNK